MKLEVLQENEDGSADVQLKDIEPEMLQLILQTGFVRLLEDALSHAKTNNKIPALLKEKPSGD
jgi:hypothetical protein